MNFHHFFRVFIAIFISWGFGATAPWLAGGFESRIPVRINGAMVVGTLTNYPSLINITNHSALAIGAHPLGYDLVFCGGDGTNILPHEIESYSNGNLSAWVKVPLLQSGVNTNLYLYFSNTNVSGPLENKKAVWDSSYVAVYHMKKVGASNLDSTSNAQHGTNVGSPAANTNGITDSAVSFDGLTSYFDCGDTAVMRAASNDLTLEMWLLPNRNGNPRSNPFGKSYGAEFTTTYESNGSLTYYHGTFGSDGGVSGSTYTSAGSSIAMPTNQWAYAAYVRQFSAGKHYGYTHCLTNRTMTSSTTIFANTASSTKTLRIGAGYAGFFPGLIDEIRISTNARPSNYIATVYNNMMFWSNWGRPENALDRNAVAVGFSNVATNTQIILGSALWGTNLAMAGVQSTTLLFSNTSSSTIYSLGVTAVDIEIWQATPSIPVGSYVLWAVTTNSNGRSSASPLFPVTVVTARTLTVTTVDRQGRPWAGGRVLGPGLPPSGALRLGTNNTSGQTFFTGLISGSTLTLVNYTPSLWGGGPSTTNLPMPTSDLLLTWTLEPGLNAQTAPGTNLSSAVTPSLFFPNQTENLRVSIPLDVATTRSVLVSATPLSGGKRSVLFEGWVSGSAPVVEVASSLLRKTLKPGPWILEIKTQNQDLDDHRSVFTRRLLFFAN